MIEFHLSETSGLSGKRTRAARLVDRDTNECANFVFLNFYLRIRLFLWTLVHLFPTETFRKRFFVCTDVVEKSVQTFKSRVSGHVGEAVLEVST